MINKRCLDKWLISCGKIRFTFYLMYYRVLEENIKNVCIILEVGKDFFIKVRNYNGNDIFNYRNERFFNFKNYLNKS